MTAGRARACVAFRISPPSRRASTGRARRDVGARRASWAVFDGGWMSDHLSDSTRSRPGPALESLTTARGARPPRARASGSGIAVLANTFRHPVARWRRRRPSSTTRPAAGSSSASAPAGTRASTGRSGSRCPRSASAIDRFESRCRGPARAVLGRGAPPPRASRSTTRSTRSRGATNEPGPLRRAARRSAWAARSRAGSRWRRATPRAGRCPATEAGDVGYFSAQAGRDLARRSRPRAATRRTSSSSARSHGRRRRRRGARRSQAARARRRRAPPDGPRRAGQHWARRPRRHADRDVLEPLPRAEFGLGGMTDADARDPAPRRRRDEAGLARLRRDPQRRHARHARLARPGPLGGRDLPGRAPGSSPRFPAARPVGTAHPSVGSGCTSVASSGTGSGSGCCPRRGAAASAPRSTPAAQRRRARGRQDRLPDGPVRAPRRRPRVPRRTAGSWRSSATKMVRLDLAGLRAAGCPRHRRGSA